MIDLWMGEIFRIPDVVKFGKGRRKEAIFVSRSRHPGAFKAPGRCIKAEINELHR